VRAICLQALRRVSRVPVYWYNLHRAKHAMKTEIATDIFGHLLAFVTVFRGAMSDVAVRQGVLV
jgi:hypothetical protein